MEHFVVFSLLFFGPALFFWGGVHMNFGLVHTFFFTIYIYIYIYIYIERGFLYFHV